MAVSDFPSIYFTTFSTGVLSLNEWMSGCSKSQGSNVVGFILFSELFTMVELFTMEEH